MAYSGFINRYFRIWILSLGQSPLLNSIIRNVFALGHMTGFELEVKKIRTEEGK
jgi:hypothetical protein